jgi:hypothetical protein
MVFIEVSVEIFSLLGCYAPLIGYIPKEKRSHLHHIRSLKSHISLGYFETLQ